jgi:hypothetical protein
MPVSVAVDVNGTSIHAIAPKIWQAKMVKFQLLMLRQFNTYLRYKESTQGTAVP